ncbi:MAG: DUF2809 domain-containing protein [Calditrichales bacterium]|nr:MAG: DUF2809 domain-containing protein [Calditrichales bacterium]
MIASRLKQQKHTLYLLIFLIPVGFLSKMVSTGYWSWIGDHLAGALYEIFWILLVYLFFSDKVNILILPLTVFSITCLLEITQLWHPPWLAIIRETYPGKILIGTTFSWWDFPFYAIGSLGGWIWLRRCEKRLQQKIF